RGTTSAEGPTRASFGACSGTSEAQVGPTWPPAPNLCLRCPNRPPAEPLGPDAPAATAGSTRSLRPPQPPTLMDRKAGSDIEGQEGNEHEVVDRQDPFRHAPAAGTPSRRGHCS